MTRTIIHIVRHGEVHNPAGILYGRLPRFRLSENGRRQAREAGRYLGRRAISALFASPLLRARQTAMEMQTCLPQIKLSISNHLSEVCTSFQGLPGEQIDRKKGDIYTGATGCSEQPEDIFRRMSQFLKQVRRRYAGRQVAAVTHGDVVTFTVLWAKGWEIIPENKTRLKQAGYPAGYPAHASITSLTFHTNDDRELPDLDYIDPGVATR